MDWVYYLVLISLFVTGLFVNILGLPGLWLMLASAGAYAWATGGRYLSWPGLLVLLALAIAAEIVEFAAGSAGAKKAGGSGRAMLGAIVGGLAGALLLSIPVPILGTIAGGCIGAFVGAVVMELWGKPDIAHSMGVGVGAVKGRLIGIAAKSMFGIVMLIVGAWRAFPAGGGAVSPPLTGATPPGMTPPATTAPVLPDATAAPALDGPESEGAPALPEVLPEKP